MTSRARISIYVIYILVVDVVFLIVYSKEKGEKTPTTHYTKI